MLAALVAGCSGGEEAPVLALPPTLAPRGPMSAPFELPVLMYHDVSAARLDDDYRAKSNVTPAGFSTQLDYLQCAGYMTITPSQLADAIDGRGGLPEKPVILTFDDGYTDHYTEVFPRLKERGMTAAFSIISGFVEGGGDYASWTQIKEMSDAGMEIMSHTVTHMDLNTAADADALAELEESSAAIEQATGRAPAFIVYPSGEPFRSGTGERQALVVSMAR
jgi:peptidoglycan/xylan/chitin deacetylase (PgdA/CDA1 family)